MRRVGRAEHGRPRGKALRSQAVMHVGGSQQTEARMTVLGVAARLRTVFRRLGARLWAAITASSQLDVNRC